MKKYGKILIIVSVLFISSVSGTSCRKNSDSNIQILSGSEKPVVSDSIEERKKSDVTKQDNMATDGYQEALANTTKLPIYCINDDTSEIETVEIFIDQKTTITPLFVTEKVVDEFSNHDLNIGIDKVSEDDKGNVIVSFTKDCAPVKGVGEDIEYLILDCISQSILDDVESSKTVIFQVEGAAYRSSDIAFKIDEAYNWK